MAMSIQERVEKGRGIYVRNMTAEPPTVVCLTFSPPGRDKQKVFVPPSPYPFQLYPGRVSKIAILEGGDILNHFLESGRLKLISSKKAKKILSDPDVMEEVNSSITRANSTGEQQRWAKEQKRIADGIKGGTSKDEYIRGPGQHPKVEMTPANPILAALKQSQSTDMAPSYSNYQLAEAGGEEGVHPRVLGIMANYTKEYDEGTLKQLKSFRSQLGSKDYHMIISRCDRGGDLWRWADKRLRKSHG